MAETAEVARLKAALSECLARVKAGEEVVVTERGRAIARIVPVKVYGYQGCLKALERSREVSLLVSKPYLERTRRWLCGGRPGWSAPLRSRAVPGRAISTRTDGEEEARRALGVLSESWSKMRLTNKLRSLAERPLAIHLLSAADALQLAAALRWCEDEPGGKAFMCLDDRLRAAARREDFGSCSNRVQSNE